MKQFFMIETKKGVSARQVAASLNVCFVPNAKVKQLKADPHSLASLEKFIEKVR